jgi:hypothetical protein
VPISEVTNIRMGSLDSTIVETETPAVVETKDVASLAQNTGNTAEDQVTPTPTDRVTPAPVINTAPEPVPEPIEEPEPTPVEETPPPEPAPTAEPEPAPVEEAAPTEIATETPAETPDQPVAPPRVVFTRPAALNKAPAKPAETKVAEVTPAPTPAKKPSETTKPVEKKPANEEAKPADQVAALINNETSRGATTGQGGSPTLGKNTGRASTLTQSQLDGLVAQIKSCMNIPAGAAEAGITAQLMFTIDASGNVKTQPQIISNPGTQLERALASAAQRAVMRCGPYQMALNQDVKATFDPRELF